MTSTSGIQMLRKVFGFYLKQGKGTNRLRGILRFIRNYRFILQFTQEAREFQLLGGSIDEISPYLHEKTDTAGVNFGQYFLQDLLVAQEVYRLSPRNHLDVGSRVDGFIAHVATTHKITFLDIRSLTNTVPNVTFLQGDILSFKSKVRYELVTSLHVLEHIGLGRYGDTLEPLGHIKAFEKLVEAADYDGKIWISFQVSEQTITQFNGQRLIGWLEPLDWAGKLGLKLEKFYYLNDEEVFQTYNEESIKTMKPVAGNLGIYFFTKAH